MTGYAAVQSSAPAAASQTNPNMAGRARLGVEIRSVNSRFLDLSFRLPDELRQLEPALRELLGTKLKRGKVELRAALDGGAANAMQPPSAASLQRLSALQDAIKSWLPTAAPFSAADVLRLATHDSPESHDHAADLLKLAKQALEHLLQARAREGGRLKLMLLDRTAQLRTLSEQVTPLIPKLIEQHSARFLERYQDAITQSGGALAEAAHDRALTEVTAFAIRIDVAEELTRLVSHVDEIERLLAAGGELGKRLDFLIQELHREANTLGAKSASLELTRISVDMKVLIEQIREQVQNIE